MIRYHWYDLGPTDRRGRGRGCHVYSDATLGELRAWCLDRGFRLDWIVVDDCRMPQLDLFGSQLGRLPPVAEGIGEDAYEEHRRFWLGRAAERERARQHAGERSPAV